MHKNANDLKVLKELKIQDNPKEEEGVKKEMNPKLKTTKSKDKLKNYSDSQYKDNLKRPCQVK